MTSTLGDFTLGGFVPSEPSFTPGSFNCESCGTELRYSGRGRKPRICTERNGGNPECISYRATPVTPGPTRAQSQPTKRVDAALAVMQGAYDQMGDFLLFVSPRASEELARRIPAQQARNRAYFEASPKLCDRVCSLGGKGGTLAFLLSNLAMLAMVGRIAYADAQAVSAVVAGLQNAGNGTAKANGEPDLSQLFSQFVTPGA